jgi:hypothetical protein
MVSPRSHNQAEPGAIHELGRTQVQGQIERIASQDTGKAIVQFGSGGEVNLPSNVDNGMARLRAVDLDGKGRDSGHPTRDADGSD